MTEGIEALRKILIGAEDPTTKGTAVAATTFLLLSGSMENTRATTRPAIPVGVLTGTTRNYTPRKGSQIKLTGEATFEQPYILEAGLGYSSDNPTTDTGSGYIYTYTIPTTAVNSPRTYTVESGDNIRCEKSTYNFCPEWTLSGKSGEAWMWDATFEGRAVVSTDSFTALASSDIPTVEEILFSMTKLYIDDSTDTHGTTLVSNTLLDASLKYKGFRSVQSADGRTDLSFVKQYPPECTLDVTFEHNSSATSEKDDWELGKTRLVRLIATGSALTSGGTYTAKTMIIDLVGTWEKFNAPESQDGNVIVKGTLRVALDQSIVSTGAGSIKIVNELAALA